VGKEGNGGDVDDNDYIVIGTIPIAIIASEGGEGVVRTAMVTMSMTMTSLSSAPSLSPSFLRACPCTTVRARRGWAWVRAMLRRRAYRRGRG